MDPSDYPSGRRSAADESHDPAARQRRPEGVDSAIPAESAARLRVDDLAHELNGLLDGSLRFVHLARRALVEDPAASEAVRQLERAGAGLTRMGSLISRAMRPGVPFNVGTTPGMTTSPSWSSATVAMFSRAA